MAKKIPSAPSNLEAKSSKPQSLLVLIVEDSESDALLEIHELKKGGYDPVYERVETAAAMKKALSQKQWDIILCDYKMPEFNAPSAIALLKETNIDIPLIIVSGAIGEETAVECMRSGAHDYIMKNNLLRLCPAIKRELEEAKSRNKRKLAEEALRESEKIFRSFMENSPIYVFFKDKNIRALQLSRNFETMLGKPMMELLGKSMHDLFPSELSKSMVADDMKIMKEGKVITVEEELNGRLYSTIKFPIFSDGKPHYLAGYTIDITDRKRAEVELRESENRYRTLFQASSDGILIADLETKVFKYANPAVCRLLGYSVTELTTMDVAAIHPKTDLPRVMAEFEAQSRGDKTLAADLPCLRKDGTIVYADIVAGAMTIDGRTCTVGFFRDITERKQAEETLRESDERFRRLADAALEGIIIHEGGIILDANESSLKMIGYPAEEVIGKSALIFLAPESIEPALLKLKESIDAPQLYLEAKGIRKDKTVFPIELFGRPIRYKNLDARVIAIRDLTERKRAEVQVRERMKELKALYSLAEMAQREDIILVELYKEFTNILPKSWLYEEIACARIVIGESEFRTENFAESAWKQSAPIKVNRKVVGKIDVGYLEERPEEDEGPFLKEERMLIDALAERLGNITERKQAEEELKQSFERLRKALGATVQSISMIVEMKDPYTAGHQQRVADLARSIATEMGLSVDQRDFIRIASTIHDIGKIALPAEILSKPTKLTNLEFSLIKAHSQSGYDILKDIDFPWPVADVVLQHHERMNGSGYPQGLKGDDILLEARILAIADVVEAMASHRPYRPSLGIETALEEIEKNRGTFYDADAADACLRLFREKGFKLT